MPNLVKYTPEYLEALDAWDGGYTAPSKTNRKRLEGMAVMQNAFLERWFGTSHYLMPGVWFIPLTGYMLWHALSTTTAVVTLGLFVVGLLLWTLLEYVLHRYLFHYVPPADTWNKGFYFVMHGYHHQFPNDRNRLVAPPVLSWPIAGAIGALYYATMGPYWSGLLAGTFIGYLGYDWVHFYTHHARPKTKIGKFLRRYHMEHHFKEHDTHYGISSPLWDVVFGTYTKPEPPTELEKQLVGDGSR